MDPVNTNGCVLKQRRLVGAISTFKVSFPVLACSPVTASFTTSEVSDAWVGFGGIDMSNLLPEISRCPLDCVESSVTPDDMTPLRIPTLRAKQGLQPLITEY